MTAHLEQAKLQSKVTDVVSDIYQPLGLLSTTIKEEIVQRGE